MDGQRGSERHRCLRRSCGVAGDRHGAVGHDAAADDHVVGEEARTMSGHAASGEADKHEGVGWGGGINTREWGFFFVWGRFWEPRPNIMLLRIYAIFLVFTDRTLYGKPESKNCGQ